MKKRSSLPLVVLLAVVALVLGTVGTATAAGLTTKQVKKIATKVVNKKAKTLSVANAANATNAANAANATNLGGKPASAYLDNASVYTTAITVAADNVDITIPLTAGGKYQLSFTAYLSGGSGPGGCYVYMQDDASTTTLLYTADSEADSSGDPAYSASGVVQPPAGSSTHLFCFSGTAFDTITTEPIQITVTPLDSVTTGTLPGVSTKPAPRH
jgi:hypothetical protein